ncbi:conserved Plasmodium protein, unknown function [Plasmodium malariae]|uniref:Seipin domain-containing protein n=1 Tax=Plasmodium malariae TaxID=5858 RepID=A0A1C3K9R8_PLAMA|nr:conserved Plasmodium protein, unknown function [Plasmodium malariae]SBT70278.1 conserved Plasmodium protein, unknown function [Plasmodium malariae]
MDKHNHRIDRLGSGSGEQIWEEVGETEGKVDKVVREEVVAGGNTSDEVVNDLVEEVVSEAMNQSEDESIDEMTHETEDETSNEPVGGPVEEHVEEQVGEPVEEQVEQVDKSADEPIDKGVANSNPNCRNREDETHSRNIKHFCKLKKKYLYLKKREYASFRYKKKRKRKRKDSKHLLNSISEALSHIIKYMNKKYVKMKRHFKNTFPNLNIKRFLYVLLLYLLINVALFLFSIFMYFFVYFYLIPQNKYIYPIDFSLARNPIEDYLKSKIYDHDTNYMGDNSTCPSMNKSEDLYLKHLHSIKSEILNSIKSKGTCCCSEKWNNMSYDNIFPFRYKRESYKNNEKLHLFDDEIEYKYLQNNILIGQANFQNVSNEEKSNKNESFYKFFIPVSRKQKISTLNIKKGYKIDVVLNFSYMNNDYNDKFSFLQLETNIFSKNDDIILRKEKMHINNKNYDFINKLYLFLNAPFYFFNVLNRRTTEISLVNDYEYMTDFHKIKIYIYPPIQIYEAYVVVLVYSNFIYYYIYKYPFLFFYVFIFTLSSFLIFVNTILFLLIGLYYYLLNKI